MKTTFKSADLKISILSNVRRFWLAMPPVAGFLEMFAGVPYNREKKRKSSLHPPSCTNSSVRDTGLTTTIKWVLRKVIKTE